MKLFLGSLFFILIGTGVTAQSQGLFPELSGLTQANRSVEATQNEAVKPNTSTQPAPLFPEIKTNRQLEQEAEDAMQPSSGNLRLVIDNVNSTLPPARNFSYCSATMTLENETGRKVDSIEIVLTFRESKVKMNFKNVDKKGRQTQDLTLAGDICQSILTVPLVDVTSCKMVGVSEDACKKRVEFVPIS